MVGLDRRQFIQADAALGQKEFLDPSGANRVRL